MEGGPRFWWERSREIRRFDSVWATSKGRLTGDAKVASAIEAANTSVCIAAIVPGQNGHCSGKELNAGPFRVSWRRSAILIVQ